jgi:malate synthase
VPIAKVIFDAGMTGPNQINRSSDDVDVAAALLDPPRGSRTEVGLRHNIRVGIQYLEAWLGGQGAVPIYNLMEDAATAEICRTQIWQWIHHHATLEDGRVVDRALVTQLTGEELTRIRSKSVMRGSTAAVSWMPARCSIAWRSRTPSRSF